MRRHLHERPELAFQEFETAEFVANRLQEWGFEVARGIAETGVVGTLRCGEGPRKIALRADMDALPMVEETGLSYASHTKGRMHACGHDGHVTMLLGAARELARSRDFSGTVHVIFQPAEEDISGAKRMVAEGIFERFPCDAVFALHNMPGAPLGKFLVRSGPIMAASDVATITLRGAGGHAAMPHLTRDPVVAGASLVMALQSIVSRNRDPHDPAVVTVGTFQAGTVSNVIPDTATLTVDVRSFSAPLRAMLEQRIRAIAAHQADSFNVTAEIKYENFYPVTVNSERETRFLNDAALRFAGPENVEVLARPYPYSEDFSYMLQVKPGSYFILGMGDGPGLHTTQYDFNDAALPIGASFWVSLVEDFLRLEHA
ncbi:M20 aminoacylase family protein [Rhodoligotrophos appendicifer]